MSRRTAIIAGFRTPFVRSGTVFKDLTAIDLGVLAVRELMDRSGVRG
jgi:acetyl-CoA acyltransferase